MLKYLITPNQETSSAMEKLPPQETSADQESKYFETYEIKNADLEYLGSGIDLVTQSKLIEEDVLDNMRFVTYDSNNLYVFTKGQHIANEKFSVEQLPSSSKEGYKIFKIPHSGFIGKERRNYTGASAWLLCDEIETTALDAQKFPNESVLYQPELKQPKEILDVVRMAPRETHDKLQQGKFSYLTDVIFHEAGHIEHRRLQDWHEGSGFGDTFPSPEKQDMFLSKIRATKIFPEWVTNLITENTSRRAITEMYPMIIDREAARLYDLGQFEKENAEFEKTLTKITNETPNPEALKEFGLLESGHIVGRLLVRILEEQFPQFEDRKRFVRSVLAPSRDTK